MKFEELDTRLRIYETAHDYCVLPEIYIVARIDGRNFTKLTRETYQFEAPFDIKFRDYMVSTTEHLMNCGFKIIYGYTQSDEISLLFHRDDRTFGRKTRKLNSILAGEASAKMSVLLEGVAAFDCRISQLPTSDLVVEYFRWRNEDAHRNALNSHCYWMLRKNGHDKNTANDQLERLSVSKKNELLFQNGINFNGLPNWQKRGIGLFWETYEKQGFNPITNQTVLSQRKQLKIDLELPMREEYSQFIKNLIN